MFSGGGGVEALLKERIDFAHAVEYDPAIAAVYRLNHGNHIQVARVEDVDYSLWGALDYLHASPVCKEFSRAKTGGIEGNNDIQTALAVVRCLEDTQPRVFTLENVGAYQHSKSYRLICRALDLAGYMWHAEVLNSADFGVPQTRRRLILRAVKDALLPGLAAPDSWVGWYAAIEDLIPGLLHKELATWAKARIPLNRMPVALIDVLNCTRNATILPPNSPSMTVQAAHGWRPSQMPVYVNGRETYVDTRIMARLQSLPDNYKLTGALRLDMCIIGNMVPSLMMLKIVEPLL